VTQPEVFGRRRTRSPSRSTRLPEYPSRLIRRIDIVTSSDPLAARESSMTCWFG
jgi:hypothetical protein